MVFFCVCSEEVEPVVKYRVEGLPQIIKRKVCLVEHIVKGRPIECCFHNFTKYLVYNCFIAFPNSLRGFPNSLWGFPNSLWGFPNSLWGFPNSPWGFPNSLWGFPNSPWDFPNSLWDFPNSLRQPDNCIDGNSQNLSPGSQALPQVEKEGKNNGKTRGE
jgi:hypothetical protein